MAKGMTFRNWWSVLYPATCVCCGEPADPDRLVCPACAETFLRITPPFCPFCGVSLWSTACTRRVVGGVRRIALPCVERA
jgi:predicted amidophosphoribosyltransferase